MYNLPIIRQYWTESLVEGILEDHLMYRLCEELNAGRYSAETACYIANTVEREINDRFMS